MQKHALKEKTKQRRKTNNGFSLKLPQGQWGIKLVDNKVNLVVIEENYLLLYICCLLACFRSLWNEYCGLRMVIMNLWIMNGDDQLWIMNGDY